MNIDNLDIVEILWTTLFILVSFIPLYLSILFFKEEKQLKKNGEKTIARIVDFSEEKIIDEDRNLSKILVYEFYDLKQNLIRVKSKTTRSGKIGEDCAIYYDIKNPNQKYYLEKDFLRKYILLVFGLFFLTLGVCMMYREFN